VDSVLRALSHVSPASISERQQKKTSRKFTKYKIHVLTLLPMQQAFLPYIFFSVALDISCNTTQSNFSLQPLRQKILRSIQIKKITVTQILKPNSPHEKVEIGYDLSSVHRIFLAKFFLTYFSFSWVEEVGGILKKIKKLKPK